MTNIDQIVDVIVSRVEKELSRRLGNSATSCESCASSEKLDIEAVTQSLNEGSVRIGSTVSIEDAPCGHVASYIDHTLLKPEATRDDIKKMCEEARRFNFASVCVNSSQVRLAAACLEGSQTMPIAVIGFPLGAATTGAKSFETKEAIRNGAKEIDMVVNIGAVKARDHLYVLEDIRAVVKAAGRTPVKVILETSKLTDEEKIFVCALSKAAGAAFVKTSTGFGGGGATPEDVALMRRIVGTDMGVKASGGIRTIDDAEKILEAGADRIGASSSVQIVQCKVPAGKSGGY